MTLLYIFCFTACMVSISAAPQITVSAEVGSTIVLPCEWRDLPIKTPHVTWYISLYLVFERQGKKSRQGEGYEGRVDVPEDELRNGNCSLVLKNVSLTDDGLYKSFMMEYVERTNSERIKEIYRVTLSVSLQISAAVGSTVVLPCEWRDLSIKTPHVKWYNGSEIVFERQGKETHQGKAYEGRVDVPEDELLKGNCSLVLKNFSVTDAAVYTSSMLMNDTENLILVQRVKLSVNDKPETQSDKKSDSS
ncbi:uncharacterized protein DAT39_023577, partial [Clarias magur]